MSQVFGAAVRAPVLPLGADVLQQQFQNNAYWSLRQLVCHVDQDRIILRGCVPCYYLKQVAQSLAVKTVGVEHVHCDIEVQSD
jgi:hypothetical protein